MNGTWYISVLPAIGWLIVCAGLVLSALALFRDRAHRQGVRRRRCPKCWYDMAGLPGLVCPECGHAVDSERALGRTRRRWRRAAGGAAMVLAAYPALIAPDVADRGWGAAIPGTLLVLWPMDVLAWIERYPHQRYVDSGEGLMQQELARRVEDHHLRAWQFWILDRRIADAYARRGRYGVHEDQCRTLAVLEARPLRRNVDGTWDPDLPAQVRATGLEVRWDGLAVRLGTTPIDPQETVSTLLDGLVEAFEWPRSHGWVPERGGIRLVPGYEFERQTTCLVYGVEDLAPVRIVYEPRGDCGLSPSMGDPVRQVQNGDQQDLMSLIQELVYPSLWDDAGGSLGRIDPVGESLVVVATPAMHVRIARLLELMRRAIAGGGGAVARAEQVPSPGGESGDSVGPEPANTGLMLYAYNLDDLARPGSATGEDDQWDRVDSIASQLMEAVDADLWWGNGGDRGRCFVVPPLLIVEAPVGTHAGVEGFLAGLRR